MSKQETLMQIKANIETLNEVYLDIIGAAKDKVGTAAGANINEVIISEKARFAKGAKEMYHEIWELISSNDIHPQDFISSFESEATSLIDDLMRITNVVQETEHRVGSAVNALIDEFSKASSA